MGRLHWDECKDCQSRAGKTEARTLLGRVSAPPASRLTLQLHSMPCKAMLVLRSSQPQVSQASWISKLLCSERHSCSTNNSSQESQQTSQVFPFTVKGRLTSGSAGWTRFARCCELVRAFLGKCAILRVPWCSAYCISADPWQPQGECVREKVSCWSELRVSFWSELLDPTSDMKFCCGAARLSTLRPGFYKHLQATFL